MALLHSLLTAIVRVDGDALVLHAGERPYVVAPSGQKDLSARMLTLDAVTGILGELLPEDARRTLDEDGAVQHTLTASGAMRDQHFTVVAARGGDDIWLEIRRHRKVVEQQPAPPVMPEAVAAVDAVPPPEAEPVTMLEPAAAGTTPEAEIEPVSSAPVMELVEDEIEPIAPAEPAAEVEDEETIELVSEPPTTFEPVVTLEVESTEPATTFETVVTLEAESTEPATTFELTETIEAAEQEVHEISLDDLGTSSSSVSIPTPTPISPPPEWVPEPPPINKAAPVERAPEASPRPEALPPPEVPPSRPSIVLPLARHHVRHEQPTRFSQPPHTAGIDRLLRIAAARGASTLYLTSQSRPSIRVDGEIGPIEGEAVLSEPEVEALMLDLMPERNREALRSEAGTEWICDVPDVGRIRCVTFRDHRGAGGIFRMIPARAISAEQLGLSREIQGLCDEAEGLVLVTGPRASGKSTLISAFVDLINRTRSDHVITLENQIKFVHENRGSLVSQREVRGDNSEWMKVARAALRENPDVLVIEEFGSPEIVTLALEAAQSGHLVIGALTAHTTSEAIDRIIDQTPPERRPKIQLGLAEALRGVVAQVLLRKTGGGRVAAREVLLNTSAVANLIAEGKTSQLPMAIDSGRKHGMVPLNDALVAFVESGVVDSREAYRQAADQPGFLALLKRQGIDTSFVERLA